MRETRVRFHTIALNITGCSILARSAKRASMCYGKESEPRLIFLCATLQTKPFALPSTITNHLLFIEENDCLVSVISFIKDIKKGHVFWFVNNYALAGTFLSPRGLIRAQLHLRAEWRTTEILVTVIFKFSLFDSFKFICFLCYFFFNQDVGQCDPYGQLFLKVKMFCFSWPSTVLDLEEKRFVFADIVQIEVFSNVNRKLNTTLITPTNNNSSK